MKTTVLLAITLIAITLVAGCTSGPTTEQPRTYKDAFINKPTVVITTTRGEIRVVLFASSENEKHYEIFFRFFVNTATRGYYNGIINPVYGRSRTYETVMFYRAENPRSEHTIETQKFLNVQPTHGTLYYNNKQTARDLPMPRAIVSHFCIVTKTSQDFGYPKEIMLPNAGTTYCIGQVVEGMDVLEKLAAKNRDENKDKEYPVDRVISIKQGPDYKVSARKYADLCNGRITRFDEVLETKK